MKADKPSKSEPLPTRRLVSLWTVVSMLTAGACLLQAGTLVPITAVTGSHGGDQYANGMVSLTNGSGITKADPADPATLTFSGAA